ncbi:DNA-directed RNA polymerase subunit beta [Mucilaginibacter sp. PAMC 26640]|nr:DNA-directed RNA polymerase subunit beta [Mucilaginibacter sp. PAMC 26640]
MSSVEISSSEAIDILIVIDTEYVKKTYPHPSQDPNNPTGIDHTSQFMICSDPRGGISGQGTADLNFRANPGDTVWFRGTSIYQNSDDAVIVYNIKYWSGDKVFNQFTPVLVKRNRAVMPDVNTSNGLPAVQAALNFTSLNTTVSQSGTENFYVYIALYTLGSDGQTQNLFGYYFWDPSCTVPA